MALNDQLLLRLSLPLSSLLSSVDLAGALSWDAFTSHIAWFSPVSGDCLGIDDTSALYQTQNSKLVMFSNGAENGYRKLTPKKGF